MSHIPFALFEDRYPDPGQPAAWLFDDLQDSWVIRDEASLEMALDSAHDQGMWSVWALDYELGARLDAKVGRIDPEESLGRICAFRTCHQLDAPQLNDWWAAQGPVEPAGVGGLALGVSEAEYLKALDAIQSYIRAGDCYQINYTFPLHFQAYGSPLALYQRLRERQPVRYGGLVCGDWGSLISLSPELFVARQGQRLQTRPMKGTAPRAPDCPQDTQAMAALAASEKNRAENLMIVDLLRNDLGRLARPGSVTVSELFAVEAYPTLYQMVSQVEAESTVAPDGKGDLALLRALFPCGSITGTPKIRAMQIIDELESSSRGIYTGCLGWRAPEGDLRLNVAIRTLELDSAGQGKMGVGGGIVADSTPHDEWQECLLKGRFLTDLDPGLALIETLRLEVQGGKRHFPRLAGHIQRMGSSATWLGFPWSREAMLAALDQLNPDEGTYRVRLTLDKSGQFQVSWAALAPEPQCERLLILAEEAIDGSDPLRRHKTTARRTYDRALAAVASRPEVFDVLFLNQQGQVAEGARSTVFALVDGHWLTPPLEAGALPGVLRAELLTAGTVREQELRLEDLLAATEVRCGNALRGWVKVRLELNGPGLPELP